MVTWEEIKEIVHLQLKSFQNSSNSVYGCISRLVNSVTNSIERHS